MWLSLCARHLVDLCFTDQEEGADEVERLLRHAAYWQQQAYPAILVIRTSDGTMRWMNVTEYLWKQGRKQVTQIVFKGEPFTAQALHRLRDRILQTLAPLS